MAVESNLLSQPLFAAGTKVFRGLWALLCLVVLSPSLQAHPMAPGLWAFKELPSTTESPAVAEVSNARLFQVTWKTSTKPLPGVKPEPRMPAGCTNVSAPVAGLEGTGKTLRWTMRCDWQAVSGQQFVVDGLKGSPVGVLLRLSLLDGRHYHKMLSSEESTYVAPPAPGGLDILKDYTFTGVEHLLGGLDHVLFVLVLALLVGWGKSLVWTITLFTLGHSLTLALAVLGYVNFPTMLVEAMIALSIVIAAVELVKQDKTRLFYRRPWLMSGCFGLLHGMGFAGALTDVGLPVGDIPLALAAFNIGIELGQLLVIVVFFALWRVLKQSAWFRDPAPLWRLVPVYCIGGLAAMWFWQRLGAEVLLGA